MIGVLLFADFGDSLARCHCFDGTYKKAKVTANALFSNEVRTACRFIETDGLMAAVVAAEVTASAAYAFLVVEFRENVGLAIHLVGADKLRKRFADNFIKAIGAFSYHPVLNA